MHCLADSSNLHNEGTHRYNEGLIGGPRDVGALISDFNA